MRQQSEQQAAQFQELSNRYNQLIAQMSSRPGGGGSAQPPPSQQTPTQGQPPVTAQPPAQAPQGPPEAWGDPVTGTIFPASQWANGQPPPGTNLVPLRRAVTPATPAAPGGSGTPATPAAPAAPAGPATPAAPAAPTPGPLPPGWVMMNGVAVKLSANDPFTGQPRAQMQSAQAQPVGTPTQGAQSREQIRPYAGTPSQPVPPYDISPPTSPAPIDQPVFGIEQPIAGAPRGRYGIPSQPVPPYDISPPMPQPIESPVFGVPPNSGQPISPRLPYGGDPVPMPIIMPPPQPQPITPRLPIGAPYVAPTAPPPAPTGSTAAPSDLAQRQMEAAMKGLPLPNY
jgi:hypothetical protein